MKSVLNFAGTLISCAVNVWLWVTWGNPMSYLSGFVVGAMVAGAASGFIAKTIYEKD